VRQIVATQPVHWNGLLIKHYRSLGFRVLDHILYGSFSSLPRTGFDAIRYFYSISLYCEGVSFFRDLIARMTPGPGTTPPTASATPRTQHRPPEGKRIIEQTAQSDPSRYWQTGRRACAYLRSALAVALPGLEARRDKALELLRANQRRRTRMDYAHCAPVITPGGWPETRSQLTPKNQ
jgi:hypothetical protein